MSDATPIVEPGSTDAAAEPKTSSHFWQSVTDLVTAQGASVEEAAVQHFAQKEIAARVEKTIAAVEALKAAEAEMRKVKPDVVTYNEDGTEASASYTKAGAEARRKLQEKIDKIKAALSDVFNQRDFDKLKKLPAFTPEKPDGKASEASRAA